MIYTQKMGNGFNEHSDENGNERVIDIIDHDLMKSLEYKGEYGGRYTCRDCKHIGNDSEYIPCKIQGVNVSPKNNVCRYFESKIFNSSAPKFDFDDYLEFLGSDFYRPYSIDKTIINGSAKLGEVVVDGGRLAELLPDIYSPWYQYYDKPYCRVFMPRCHVESNGNKFEIDYKRYREVRTIENGELHFDLRLWKDKPTQRRYQKEVYGTVTVD